LSSLPQGQERYILLTTFHAAHVSPINTHSLGHRLLAKACGKAVSTQVFAKD